MLSVFPQSIIDCRMIVTELDLLKEVKSGKHQRSDQSIVPYVHQLLHHLKRTLGEFAVGLDSTYL